MPCIPSPRVGPLMARRYKTSSDVPVPVYTCRGRPCMPKTTSCLDVGCLAAGLNLETGQLSCHYIADISHDFKSQPTNKPTNSSCERGRQMDRPLSFSKSAHPTTPYLPQSVQHQSSRKLTSPKLLEFLSG